MKHNKHYCLEWQTLLVYTQYPSFLSFSLTAYGEEMCQSKIVHFTISFAYGGGHWTVPDDGI